MEVPPDEGEEAVVTNSAGGEDGCEVRRAASFCSVVGAGWADEVSSKY